MIAKLEIDFWENPSLYTENKNIIYGIVNVLRNKNGDPTVQEKIYGLCCRDVRFRGDMYGSKKMMAKCDIAKR
jgi:hypothetical protein